MYIFPAPPVASKTALLLKCMNLTGGQLIGCQTAADPIFDDQGQVHEIRRRRRSPLQALLPEGIENHSTGSIGCKAGALNGRLAKIAGVAAKSPLGNFAFRRCG